MHGPRGIRRIARASRNRTGGLLALALLAPEPAVADAIVQTRAMLAGTIAEYRIEPGRVVLELEVSAADLPAFPNLLPDPLYEELGNEPRPLAERLPRFFEHDLVVRADGGDPLPGRVLEIGPRPRQRRDPITGEPLPLAEGEEPELAVFGRFEYALPERPAKLDLHGPRTGTPVAIGFVAYHQGVAVNDFRYLTPVQTLTLDWDDPWYSRFARRTLRRQNFAPMSGFLYVEPYEVRKEIIARPLDLQRFVDLGIEGVDAIPAEQRPEVTRRIGEFLRDRQAVRIDGAEITPELARVNFLERTLRTSRVVPPDQDVDLVSAVVGTIFVYPTDGLPQEATMEWDLWDDRITRIPVSAVDQAGPLPGVLEPRYRVLTWTNFLKNPRMPALEILAAPPGVLLRSLQWTRWLLAGVLVLAAIYALRARARGGSPRWVLVATVSLATGAAFLGAAWTGVSQRSATEIVHGLLTNVYRAFDYRDEERIYDTLAASTDGAVLEKTYLETRRGLELQSQGGARAKVESVEVVALDLRSADGDGFEASATWNVAGAVGHWGHIHTRRNQYEALLTIAPVEGAWKLVDLEIVREERQ